MLGEPLVLGTPHVVGVRFSGALLAGRDGDRPRADADRAAAHARRRRLVRRVLRRRALGALAGRPRDALQHVPRVRRDDGALPGRRRDAALPARDRPRTTPAELVDRYAKEQGLFRRDGDETPVVRRAARSSTSRRVVPSLAGPSRPQDRVALPDVPRELPRGVRRARHRRARSRSTAIRTPMLRDGSVVIAAITSCTNTSNPSVMVAAGLLARNAVERGLRTQALGQDEPRAGLARRHRLPRGARADAVPRPARLPARRLRLHDLHRQLRPAAGRGRRRPSRAASSPSPRCSPATATSRAASTRRCARATSRLPRSWSPTRSPGASTSTSQHEPLGTDDDGAAGLPARALAVRRGGRRR